MNFLLFFLKKKKQQQYFRCRLLQFWWVGIVWIIKKERSIIMLYGDSEDWLRSAEHSEDIFFYRIHWFWNQIANAVIRLVYSAGRSGAVVPVLVLLFVALWFILRGNLLYVFLCVILFLCFLVFLVLRLPRLGKRELILVLFVRLFDLCLFWFVGFHFLLGSGKGCGLWLWHSLDFTFTFFPMCIWKILIMLFG